MILINRVAVLGAGVMGAAIAAHLANAGLSVLLLDRIPDQLNDLELKQGLNKESPKFLNRLASEALQNMLKAKPAPFFVPDRARQIQVGNFRDDLKTLKDCDWVIEAIIEDPKIKATLYAQIVPNLGMRTILSTNTSGIPVNHLAEHLPDEVRSRFLLTHFFNPPRYMHLIELVPCRATDRTLLASVAEFLELRLGKGVVLGKDTPNFVGNRIGVFALLNAIHHMVELGMTVEQVDAVAGKATARPKTGVFRTADLVGIDTLVHVARLSWKALSEDEQRQTFQLPDFLENMLNSGMHGDKSGHGFYRKEKTLNGTVRQVLDFSNMSYRTLRQPEFPSLKKALKLDDPKERLAAMVNEHDQGAEFAWRNLRDTIIYATNRIPEIADGIEQIDRAMRWGFNWEIGPFEMLDVMGVHAFVQRARKDGIEVPKSLDSVERFYRFSKGCHQAWDLRTGAGYRDLKQTRGEVKLTILKSLRARLAGNQEASIHDLNDGVLGLEFHSKMNSISPETLDMVIKAVEIAERQGVGLVIGNQGKVFSAGANLAVLLSALEKQSFAEIEKIVTTFQNASMTLKYAKVPVVVAPFNLTLGGACEFCLHADAIVADAETYMGLVEVGVGILPAGGGCKEMAIRASELAERNQSDVTSFLYKALENIGMAKVSTSAEELFDFGYMRHGDSITMNTARLLGDAKKLAQALAANYRPKLPNQTINAGGEGLAASMRTRLWNLNQGGFISDHDHLIASAVVKILCGGEVPEGTTVDESYLLELEREGFLSLVGTPKTRQRIEHMLKTGKPLRN
ncbi:MAG: 3-hydroxyacyl-CoA dehydrogenase [Deltaproteobacteria bacterium]|jgi:3-hydroxyacyl-CoA dehydrogenase|nr:3-hydroxyacyl-CoA dehydrogenase [Deltaproteobacteria bacterium]